MIHVGHGRESVFPDFMIVGAMKAGTNSLRYHLEQHPDVAFANKRPHYFDRDHNWERGPEWYAQFFEHARGVRLVGEWESAYSYRPGKAVPIPRRIVSVVPEAKILWILRNPIDRAYSHYWFYVSRGRESRSFSRALAENRTRGIEAHRDYQGRGIYVEQIELYLHYFRRDQLHILLLNDLRTDAAAAIKRVFAFLGVDPDAISVQACLRRNRTYRPWSKRLQWLLRRAVIHRDEQLYNRLARLMSHRKPGYPAMDPALRAELARFYAPHNRALAELTGLDLSHWDELSPAGAY